MTSPSPSRAATFAVAFAAALLLPASVAGAQEVLYGSTASNSPSGGRFGTVDQIEGGFTELGDPTPNGPLPAIAMNAEGQVFGSRNSPSGGSSSVGELIRIDPANGTLLATIGIITDVADEQQLKVTDLDFQPGTGVLFGIIARGDKEGSIYTIDTTTASATLVGSTGLNRGGLAFAPDGTLYVASVSDQFARVDPNTAAVIGDTLDMGLGCEGLAIRPSDGVIFATEDDGSDLFTIDPLTGTPTTIGSANVADLTFQTAEGGPPTEPTESFLHLENASLFVHPRIAERSRLSIRARLDDCCAPADFSQPVTLDVNGTTWELPGLTGNRRGTSFRLRNDEVTLVIRPRQRGTSRGRLTLRIKRDLTGIVEPDGGLAVQLTSGALDVTGAATLAGKRYTAGRRGELGGMTLVPLSLRGRLREPDGTTLSANLLLAGTSPGANDVTVTIGDFEQVISADDFSGSDDRPRFSSREPGVRSLRIDHARGQIRVALSRATIGYSSGDLTLQVRVGDQAAAVTITPRVRGSSITY